MNSFSGVTKLHIGIFGGTFDPPHISHTLACLYVLETTGVDEIWMIPCYQHPLGKSATDFHHRITMCRLAVKRIQPGVIISELESERKGPSYTIDTLKVVKKRKPGARLSLIIGSDILKEAHLWKSFDEIKETAELIVLPRPVPDQKGNHHPENKTEKPFVFPAVSSTMVRDRITRGKDISSLVSNAVVKYIRNHGLYGLSER